MTSWAFDLKSDRFFASSKTTLDVATSIPEPILVVYGEPPKAIATTGLRQMNF